MQFYSDTERESDDYALPDAEVFYMDRKTMREYGEDSFWYNADDKEYLEPGWYYWACFPGCLPDSDPVGPFDSEESAIADAQEQDF